MNDTVEKSCWNITLWAVVAVLGIVFLSSALSGAKKTIAISDAAKVSAKVASN